MRASTYTNRKEQEKVGLQLTLGEAAGIAKEFPELKISLTFTPEQASDVAARVNGDVRKALADAGVKARKQA